MTFDIKEKNKFFIICIKQYNLRHLFNYRSFLKFILKPQSITYIYIPVLPTGIMRLTDNAQKNPKQTKKKETKKSQNKTMITIAVQRLQKAKLCAGKQK